MGVAATELFVGLGRFVGMTAMPDSGPDERCPNGGGKMPAVDDQPGEGYRRVNPAEHQSPLGRVDRELGDEQHE